MNDRVACFKAYDVRGRYPDQLDDSLAYDIARAFADFTGAERVCVGRDVRLSGSRVSQHVVLGLVDSGVDVVDLDVVATEMLYFAVGSMGACGGIMVTASHNPPEYTGMKFVRREAKPISGDTGLNEIKQMVANGSYRRSGHGHVERRNIYKPFIDHLLKIAPINSREHLRLLLDPVNGTAGLVLQQLLPLIPVDATVIRAEPDGAVPNGLPNPTLPETHRTTQDAIRNGDYAFGAAWDGDSDRCFLFDESGSFIEPFYIVGLLSEAVLMRDPSATIVHDPRLTWNTLDIVEKYGGTAVVCKTGHAFFKEKMREVNAAYGGEMSAHHYFRDNWYCDSGMIPFLLIAQLVSDSGQPLGEMVSEMIDRYPCSGEINSVVENVQGTLQRVESEYKSGKMERIDGLSVEFDEWRFNLRGSNTEPVIRLNVESRGSSALVAEKAEELLGMIRR